MKYSLNEQLRQAYLRTMGIDVFYPRAPVAGARPSPEYDFSLPAFLLRDQPVSQSGRQGDGQALPTDGTKLDNLETGRQSPQADRNSSASPLAPTRTARAALGLQEQAVRKSPASTEPPVERPAGPVGEEPVSEATPNFRLEYKLINSQLAVLLEVPLHAQRQLGGQTAQLLANILLALETGAEDGESGKAGTSEPFNWPLLDGLPAEEATARRASQALLGFIAMRRQRDRFKNLLVFTSQSGQILELLPEASTAPGCDYRLEKLDCWLTHVSSLQEMLSVPSMKREVWQELQPLRKRLLTDQGS